MRLPLIPYQIPDRESDPFHYHQNYKLPPRKEWPNDKNQAEKWLNLDANFNDKTLFYVKLGT